MTEQNGRLMKSFSQLEKLLNDMYGRQEGKGSVTVYIDLMKEKQQTDRDVYDVDDWEEDLRSLKNIRYKRNKIAHESGDILYSTKADVEYVCDIYDSILNGKFLTSLFNLFIFIVVVLMYKIGSGTKPKFRLCLLSGFVCTVSFWIFRTILHSFINISRYNLIYGVLGNVIVLLLDIFFFFVFFMFFAQYIFVCQFFDELLLGELYLLPKKEDSTFSEKLKRTLFIRPDFLLANQIALTYLAPGEKLYKEGDQNSFAYYILKGCIKLDRSEYEDTLFYYRGDFFGELNCILVKPRSSTATAITDTTLVKIRGKNFRFLVKSNQQVTQKVLKELSEYLTKLKKHSL